MLPGRSRSSENIVADGSNLNQEDNFSQVEPKRSSAGRPRVRSRQLQVDRYVRLEDAPLAEDYVTSRSKKRAHLNDVRSSSTSTSTSRPSRSEREADEEAAGHVQGTGGFWGALAGLMTCSRFTPFGWPCMFPLSRQG